MKSPTSPANSDVKAENVVAASYEDALGQLQALVRDLESGQLPLDTLLTHYTQGIALLEFCQSRLQVLETQVQLLDQRLMPDPVDISDGETT